MKNIERTFHFVCMRNQTWKMVEEHESLWAPNCGCRESRSEGCERSRQGLSLLFRGDIGSSGLSKKEVSVEEIKEFFHEAEGKHLVTRPYGECLLENRRMHKASKLCHRVFRWIRL